MSNGVDLVRVDLYDLGDRVVFGELTNYPTSGRERFSPSQWDTTFGSYWQLEPRDTRLRPIGCDLDSANGSPAVLLARETQSLAGNQAPQDHSTPSIVVTIGINIGTRSARGTQGDRQPWKAPANERVLFALISQLQGVLYFAAILVVEVLPINRRG
jgi:TupA-like ATPgrasp